MMPSTHRTCDAEPHLLAESMEEVAAARARRAAPGENNLVAKQAG
jgi:hypothetical protein